MQLNALQPLLDSMTKQRLLRQRFDYCHHQGAREVWFNVVFLIDVEPYLLLMGSRAMPPHAFPFEFKRDLTTNPYLGWRYQKLLEVLGLKEAGEGRFSTTRFLEEFGTSGCIPTIAGADARPRPEDIPLPAGSVADDDKPYFLRWLYHDGANRRVTDMNLARTELCFGSDTARLCATRNISSCWTADPRQRGNAVPP